MKQEMIDGNRQTMNSSYSLSVANVHLDHLGERETPKCSELLKLPWIV